MKNGIGLIATGLVAQVVGVSTQTLWHTVLSGPDTGLLTEDGTFLIDHTISNLGVAAMVVGAWQLHHVQPGLGSRLVATGTGLEVAGAVGDIVGHLGGAESPIAFASIGAGFVTAMTGVIIARRHRPDRRIRYNGSHAQNRR